MYIWKRISKPCEPFCVYNFTTKAAGQDLFISFLLLYTPTAQSQSVLAHSIKYAQLDCLLLTTPTKMVEFFVTNV